MALKNITTTKKLRGNMIRSEARWVKEGKKPTNYFCHLKSRNFLNNTIKKVEVPEKGVIFNQFDILANCNETLYKNLDSELYDVGLSDKYTDI